MPCHLTIIFLNPNIRYVLYRAQSMKQVPKFPYGLSTVASTIFLVVTLSACSDRGNGKQPHITAINKTSQTTNYRLEDISAQLGMHEHSSSWSAATSDFNNSGRPDIVVVRHDPYQTEGLYLNRGEYFEILELGYRADRHHCTPGDVNRDGREDIYCTVGARKGAGQGNNNLFIQQEDGTFEDRAEAYGVQDPFGRGRYAVFLNANGDSYPDLLVTNALERTDGENSINHLYINEDGKKLRSAEEYGADDATGTRCLIAEDVNADGFDDFLICSGRLFLYLNSEGKHFVKSSEKIATKSHWRRAAFSDMNNDGILDLLVLNRSTLQIIVQVDGKFEQVLFETNLIEGMDLAVGDVEGDGDNDVYIVQADCKKKPTDAKVSFLDQPDFLLVNEGDGSFHKVLMPLVKQECGHLVISLDYNSDGDSEFLVLNGSKKSKGPVQLIELQPPKGY